MSQSISGLTSWRCVDGRKQRLLLVAQLRGGDVAADEVAVADVAQRRVVTPPQCAELAGAARLETAAARELGQAGDRPVEADPLARPVDVERRNRGEQRLGVG